MLIYSATGRLTHIELLRELGHGLSRTCADYRNPKPGMPWFLDNGAFTAWIRKRPFDGDRFLRVLARLPRDQPPDVIVCPDIVAGGMESLAFSRRWRTKLQILGYGDLPWYLAVQDGMDGAAVTKELDTGRWAGVFVGGTMSWKKRTAESWVGIAHRRGLKLHVGRTPQLQDLVWAQRIGADSCDSTSWARNDRHHVLEAARKQALLYDLAGKPVCPCQAHNPLPPSPPAPPSAPFPQPAPRRRARSPRP